MELVGVEPNESRIPRLIHLCVSPSAGLDDSRIPEGVVSRTLRLAGSLSRRSFSLCVTTRLDRSRGRRRRRYVRAGKRATSSDADSRRVRPSACSARATALRPSGLHSIDIQRVAVTSGNVRQAKDVVDGSTVARELQSGVSFGKFARILGRACRCQCDYSSRSSDIDCPPMR